MGCGSQGAMQNPPLDILQSGAASLVSKSYIVRFKDTEPGLDKFYKNLRKLDPTYVIQTPYLPQFNGIVIKISEEAAVAVADLSTVGTIWPNMLLYPSYFEHTDCLDGPHYRKDHGKWNCQTPKPNHAKKIKPGRAHGRLDSVYSYSVPLMEPTTTGTAGETPTNEPSSTPTGYPVDNPPLPNILHNLTGVSQLRKLLNISGKGVKIGIIDSGLDFNHPAFGRCFKTPGCRVAYGTDLVGDNFTGAAESIQPDADPSDSCLGHGTHVAGIIAGNHGVFQGVAPEATLGIYKVSSCPAKGATTSAALILAMQQALKDGMHVVNLSYGRPGGWQESPEAVMAQILTERNIVVVAAVGNDGQDTLWAPAAPSTGHGVTAVGSATPPYFYSQYFTLSTLPSRRIGHSPPQEGVRPFAFKDAPAVLAVDSASSNLGCNPYPANAYPQHSLFVIHRGGCAFSQKARMALEAGATALAVIATSDIIDGGLTFDTEVNLPTVLVTLTDGHALTTALQNAADGSVTASANLDWVVFPYAQHDRVSMFSTWGPGNELEIKPDVSAYGSLIYSTYPVAKGSYAVESGTSAASPYVAGVMALLVEAQKFKFDATNLYNRVLMTAVPLTDLATGQSLDSVAHQGSGNLNAYNAYVGAVANHDVSFALNDTLRGKFSNGQRTVNLVIRNSGKTAVSVELTHRPALSATTYDSSGTWMNSPRLDTAAASVTITAQSFTLRAQATRNIAITIRQPAALADSQFWIYSGFLNLATAQVGFNHQPINYTIPYLGLKGSYYQLPILSSPSGGLPTTLANASTNLPGETVLGATGGFATHTDPHTYTLVGVDRPTLAYRIEHPLRRIAVKVVNATGGSTHMMGTATGGEAYYLERNIDSTGNVYSTYSWDGRFYVQSSPNQLMAAPSGNYTLRFYFVKPFGNPSIQSNDSYIYTSPVFSIRPGATVAVPAAS
ncbi:hypothetical protein IWQ60_006004 [Tieghemiomyces parasiticus]|uniref:Subtilisin n=1 Tax=Tieghemiomyces parasiticus TaxID=78921 RepID=A0A9W8DXZ6_9FUNG|nr:hypothetical protein IWQ60_006004 [Tieghemiomyces parasiticus]